LLNEKEAQSADKKMKEKDKNKQSWLMKSGAKS